LISDTAQFGNAARLDRRGQGRGPGLRRPDTSAAAVIVFICVIIATNH
jgi:hypothetical protein